MEFHLAPMKNITTWNFRRSIKAATDSYVEMINLEDLLRGKPTAWERIDTFEIPHQRQWIQVLTHDVSHISRLPSVLGAFCEDNPERSFIHGVNINAGCPDPNVIRAGDGAALIKRTTRLFELVRAFLRSNTEHQFHISVKMRLGLNEKEMHHQKVVSFLKRLSNLEDERLGPTIIHFKHAKQSSDDVFHWEFLPSILKTEMPIILNGGITQPDDLKIILDQLDDNIAPIAKQSVKGIMIGRAAIQDHECFTAFNQE